MEMLLRIVCIHTFVVGVIFHCTQSSQCLGRGYVLDEERR